MRSFIVLVLVSVVLLSSCVRMTDENGRVVRLTSSEVGLSLEKNAIILATAKTLLKAQVKGSIYETGEWMSVFGTCLGYDDLPLVQGTYATFNAWYPNGTIFLVNDTMGEMQPGYYVYTGPMSAVQGTYLTEMICHVNGTEEIAKAWGEWQNPYWVKRIELLNQSLANMSLSVDLSNITGMLSSINETVNQINTTVGNISIQIGNLTLEVQNSFIQTWQNQNATNTLINETYTNLTQQIVYVGQVANASVDRNDSYLANLINLLVNHSGVPATQVLTLDIDADDPVYYRNWEVRVEVKNEYNVSVGYPIISCFINTTNSPETTNQLMTVASDMHWKKNNHHAPIGFKWTEKLYVTDFDYSIWCVYN